MKRRLQFIFWTVSFLLALGCIGIFIQGLMRDFYTGDPVVRLDPKAPTEWITSPFRVWGKGSYALRISSVNHDPDSVGRLLQGEVDVRVIDPDQNVFLEKTYRPGLSGHRVPSNYGDTLLETLELDGWPLRSWRLQVRVSKVDLNFVTARTELRLRKHRYDPGMGGLMNYAMIVPAGIFLVVAFLLSLFLAQAGTRTPLIVTIGASLAFLVFLV